MAIIKRETDYAFRALARIAQAEDFLPVSVLAEGEHVPEVFLRKIMQRLHAAGIVESRHGPFGGYRLALPPSQITFLDVVETVQGPLVMNECFESRDICGRQHVCPVRARLSALQIELNAGLAEVKIADILEGLPSVERAAK